MVIHTDIYESTSSVIHGDNKYNRLLTTAETRMYFKHLQYPAKSKFRMEKILFNKSFIRCISNLCHNKEDQLCIQVKNMDLMTCFRSWILTAASGEFDCARYSYIPRRAKKLAGCNIEFGVIKQNATRIIL